MQTTRTKKKGIIIGSVVAVLLAAVLGLLLFAGNYFVDYALVPKSQEELAADTRAPQNTGTAQEQENKKRENALVEEWLKEVTIREEHITSGDGLKLYGKQYLQREPTNRWVIAVHGYTSNHEDMLRPARRFFEQGYHVLTPDLRAHGSSEGGYIGMGWLDKEDILLWIDAIVAENPEAEIILYGRSMGGATVMMTAGESLPGNIKAVVEDCGYTSAYEMFVEQLEFRFGLPEYPILPVADWLTNLRAGYSLKEADTLSQVKKTTLPMMFIHGDQDTFVPVEMVYRLYEAASTEKDLLIIPGAEHGNAADMDPDTYYNAVFAFLEKVAP